jgi:hypothetical protein
MGFSRDLGLVTTDEIAGVAKLATQQGNAVASEEAPLIAGAIAAAKALVMHFGGEAHVHIAGSSREAFYDRSTELNCPKQENVTISVSRITAAVRPAAVIERAAEEIVVPEPL